MDRYSTLGCFNIAGAYGRGDAKIGYNKGQLIGHWININRVPFNGSIRADCRGKMTFPDHSSDVPHHKLFELEFDKVLNKIFWDGKASGNNWTKGN